METLDFPLHKGARTALYVAAVLCIILICAAPVGAYFIWRVRKAKVAVSGTGLRADALMSEEITFSEVERLGLLRVPLVARGLGGMLARMKLNNMDHGVNLVAKLRNGKNVKVLLNQFERHDEIIAKVQQACPSIPMEDIPMGMLTWKWP